MGKSGQSFLINFIAACGGTLSAVAITAPLFAQPAHPNQPADAKLVKVVSYNCQFLPGLAAYWNKRGGAAEVPYRVRVLGRRLSEAAYDVIGLNEVFDRQARRELQEHLADEFQCLTPPLAEQSAWAIDSGLMLAVRRSLTIVTTRTFVYGNDSSPLVWGIAADGFARKGAIYARVGSPEDVSLGACLEVYLTHLESHVPAIRQEQWKQLATFVKDTADPQNPVLILGDLNTDGRAGARGDRPTAYQRGMALLRAARPCADVLDVWPSLSAKPGGTNDPGAEDGGARIDYVLISNPRGNAASLRPLRIRVDAFRDPRVVSLSDHCAVETVIAWTRKSIRREASRCGHAPGAHPVLDQQGDRTSVFGARLATKRLLHGDGWCLRIEPMCPVQVFPFFGYNAPAGRLPARNKVSSCHLSSWGSD